ncbi:hypothetical protein [Larkinella rosea]|uniref:Uncharacterized protein n=1 Tax=Larkinella rosea TaxID=2025312 RepID=A0A3P1BP43_9BACT|nr:hypothetical protein [Larkinella rosea]RRB02832.1 hypothetical protein EHT25_20555 [Larkinella rosea]
MDTEYNSTKPLDFLCTSAECDKNRDGLGGNDMEIAMLSAFLYWKQADCNSLATSISNNDIDAVTEAINGGQNGQDSRRKYTKKAYEILNK